MKTTPKLDSLGWRLGLAALTLTLAGAWRTQAAEFLIVNETYDPPTLMTPGGWTNGLVENLSWQYVREGVGKTTGLQVSATFPGTEYEAVATCMYQSGVASGNEWATRDNTVLSFNLKVDRPGLAYIGIFLDAFTDYGWTDMSLPKYSGSLIPVTLGAYKPGVFMKVVVPLNSPAYQFDLNPDPNIEVLAPLFDPSARTFNNITLLIDTNCLPVPGSFTVTVDNVKVTTKNAMIPFSGKTSSTFEFTADALRFTEKGVAEHIGNFVAKYELPYGAPAGTAEITAANGDKLLGTFIYGWGIEFGVRVEQGTGRFQGALGSYRGFVTGFDMAAGSYTAILQGGLSTIGSNQEASLNTAQ